MNDRRTMTIGEAVAARSAAFARKPTNDRWKWQCLAECVAAIRKAKEDAVGQMYAEVKMPRRVKISFISEGHPRGLPHGWEIAQARGYRGSFGPLQEQEAAEWLFCILGS